MNALRLFIAIPVVSPDRINRVLNALSVLSGTVKPVKAAHLHFTLRFLGNTDVKLIDALSESIDQVASMPESKCVDIRFTGLDRFPARGGAMPRVIFAVAEPAEPLSALSEWLDHRLARIVPPLPERDRPFAPHLTLARVKNPRYGRQQGDTNAIRDLLERYRCDDLGSGRLDAIHLIQSSLTPAGPVYETVHQSQLSSG